MPVFHLSVENHESGAQNGWSAEYPDAQAAREKLIVELKYAAENDLKEKRACHIIARLKDTEGNELYNAKLILHKASPDETAIDPVAALSGGAIHVP